MLALLADEHLAVFAEINASGEPALLNGLSSPQPVQGLNGQNMRRCECDVCHSIQGMQVREQNIQRCFFPGDQPYPSVGYNISHSSHLPSPEHHMQASHPPNHCILPEDTSPHLSSPEHHIQASHPPNHCILPEDTDLALAIEESLQMNNSISYGDDMENYFENYQRSQNHTDGNEHVNGDIVSEPSSPWQDHVVLRNHSSVRPRPHSLVGNANEADGIIGIPPSQSDSSGRSSMHPSQSGNTTESKPSGASDCDSDEGGVYVLPDDVTAARKKDMNDSFDDHGDFIETDIPGRDMRGSSADSSHNHSGDSTSSSYEDLQPALVARKQTKEVAKVKEDETFTKLVFDADTDSDSYVDMRSFRHSAGRSWLSSSQGNSSPLSSSRPTNLGPLRPALPHSYNSSGADDTNNRARPTFPLTASTSSSSPKAFMSPQFSDNSAIYGVLTSGSSTGWTPDLENSEASSNCPVPSSHSSSRHCSVDGARGRPEFEGDRLRAVRSTGKTFFF